MLTAKENGRSRRIFRKNSQNVKRPLSPGGNRQNGDFFSEEGPLISVL
jgi:hypothetical protein